MKRLIFLVAFAAGYVAGSHAGRERYEQIRRVALRVKDDPRVQQKAHEAAEYAKDHLPGQGGSPNGTPAGAFHATSTPL